MNPTEALHARIDALELEMRNLRVASDPDRMLCVKETAALIGRAPRTILQNWLGSAEMRRRWKLDLLLRRDVSGRFFSTPRLVAQWKRAISEAINA